MGFHMNTLNIYIRDVLEISTYSTRSRSYPKHPRTWCRVQKRYTLRPRERTLKRRREEKTDEMALYYLFVLMFCFVWINTHAAVYLSKDGKLVKKYVSIDYKKLHNEHLASLQPGQVMPHPCAYTKNGCCKDGKTRAFGPRGEGCDMILCTDKYVQECYDKKEAKTLLCKSIRDRNNCPFSCGRCRKPAAPLTKCLQRNPVHGCCWNGKNPLKSDKSDCPPCVDVYPTTCATFSTVAGGCNSGSYGVRAFMTSFCPVECGFCSEAFKN